MEYAAKKIKILQPLQLEQENIIRLLVGGINNFFIRNTAASINVEKVDEFFERMHQLTNTSMATQKKSFPPSIRKEKTKERNTPDSLSKKATHTKTKDVLCAYCKAKGHLRADCWKLKRKENTSQNTSTSNTVAVTRETIETENTSTKDNSTEK